MSRSEFSGLDIILAFIAGLITFSESEEITEYGFVSEDC